jgi:ribose-phosphate pyrophosphokinase
MNQYTLRQACPSQQSDLNLTTESLACRSNREELQQVNPPRLSTQAILLTRSPKGGIAERVSKILGSQTGKLVLEQFPNSETRIEIHESVRNRHAFVIAESSAPVNERFMETVLLVQALKLADAARITVLLPYFPYSRQDRKADTRPPISAKIVTDMLKIAGAHQIVTVDLHATQVEGFFDGPFENLSGLSQLVKPLVANEGSDLIVVSPDAGGAKRAEMFARNVEKISGIFTPLVVMSKFRAGPDIPPQVTLSVGPELLRGKTCVLVDDMIDTGGSIAAAALALKQKGAGRVIVCASHAVFSNNAEERMASVLTDSGRRAIDQIYITDTLPINLGLSEFTRVISIAPLLAEAVARLDQPMGTLRDLKERTDLGIVLPMAA